MTKDHLITEIVKESGLRARCCPETAARIASLGIQCFPDHGAQQIGAGVTYQLLRHKVGVYYRQRYGFSPLALILIGAVLQALIAWYFRTPRSQYLLSEARGF